MEPKVVEIRGFLPETTIDYPGKLAAEIFVAGCNLRCVYCHAANLVLPENYTKLEKFSFEKILEAVKKRKGWVDGIVICGGEPLLPAYEKDIENMAMEIKEAGLLVKIDTNGTNPKFLEYLIREKLVDFIALDVKTIPEKYKELTMRNGDIAKLVEQSLAVLKSSNIDYDVRTTVVPAFHNEEIMEKIGEWIYNVGPKGKVKLYTIQNFTVSDINSILDPHTIFVKQHNYEPHDDKDLDKLESFDRETLLKFRSIMEKYAEKVRYFE